MPANKNKYKFNFDTNIKRITNTDGTATFKNDKTGQSITSEKINDKDMYLSGKNKDDVNIYTKNGTNNLTSRMKKLVLIFLLLNIRLL